MATTIAVAGKGGVGKTTISALLIRLLCQKKVVLAVDADPSTNLNQSLGLPLESTIGAVREELSGNVEKGSIPPGVAKQDVLDSKIMAALVESKGLDLLAMGRPEGPGCYCAVNNLLRASLERLGKNYEYIVTDCEAGLEHISRQTTQDIDFLLIVSDPTIRGIITAGRIKELVRELRTRVGRIGLVVNRVKGELSPEIRNAIAEHGLELIVTIPEDPNVADLEAKGMPITNLPPDSPLRLAVKQIVAKLGL